MDTVAVERTIPYRQGDTISIRPLSDAHKYNRNSDTKELKKYLGDPSEGVYYIIKGDYWDMVMTDDAKRYSRSADNMPLKIDEVVDEMVDNEIKLLEPYKDRIIGCEIGNHEYEIIKRCKTNPMKRLAKGLGVPYLGYSSLMIVRFKDATNGGRVRTVIIRSHHGFGGGRTEGAAITTFSRDMAYYDADVFLYGHVHRRQYHQVPRLGLVGNKLTAKPKHLCVCGTFLKTFSGNTDTTYSEKAGYPPVDIGGLTLKIHPLTHGWVDIGVEI